MALVDDQQRIVRQVVEQRRRRLAGRPAGEMPRVVLDAVAVADLLHHLEVEHRPLMQPLRLEHLAQSTRARSAARSSSALIDSTADPRLLARRDEMRLRIDGDLVVLAAALPGQRIERRQRIDIVAEQLDAKRLLFVRRIDLDDVAAHAERAAREVDVVALVLDLDELAEDLLARDALSQLQRQQHAVVRLRRARGRRCTTRSRR